MQTVELQARMSHPAFTLPGAMDALAALGTSIAANRVSWPSWTGTDPPPMIRLSRSSNARLRSRPPR